MMDILEYKKEIKLHGSYTIIGIYTIIDLVCVDNE